VVSWHASRVWCEAESDHEQGISRTVEWGYGIERGKAVKTVDAMSL
jgi:hypothetical protein